MMMITLHQQEMSRLLTVRITCTPRLIFMLFLHFTCYLFKSTDRSYIKNESTEDYGNQHDSEDDNFSFSSHGDNDTEQQDAPSDFFPPSWVLFMLYGPYGVSRYEFEVSSAFTMDTDAIEEAARNGNLSEKSIRKAKRVEADTARYSTCKYDFCTFDDNMLLSRHNP